MSPMTRAKGMVSMTHWGLGSDILIRPHVSKAPSNIPLFAFTNAPFGAPPQTNTSTTFTAPCVILKGIPEEHHTLLSTISGRMVFDAISYSTEWAEQSVVLGRHLPSGSEMLETPKSVRSYMTTRLLGSSCMCMDDMPMLGRTRDHDPPAAGYCWAWRRNTTKKKKKW
ncbi:hypothetical protein LXL04_008814 [Taraxacum kok-saghyz]